MKRAALMAVDLSLRATGLLGMPDDIVSGGRKKLPRYTYGESLSSTVPEHRRMERLSELEARVLEFWMSIGSPQKVAIEEYAFAATGAYAHAVGEVGGVVKLALWRAGAVLYAINSGSARKLFTGYGGPSKYAKGAVQEAVLAAGFEDFTEAEADAFCVGNLQLSRLGFEFFAAEPLVEKKTKGKKR